MVRCCFMLLLLLFPCSCGSGLTACVVALALHQVTGQLAAVYDGSWSEWGDPALDTPVVSEP